MVPYVLVSRCPRFDMLGPLIKAGSHRVVPARRSEREGPVSSPSTSFFMGHAGLGWQDRRWEREESIREAQGPSHSASGSPVPGSGC